MENYQLSIISALKSQGIKIVNTSRGERHSYKVSRNNNGFIIITFGEVTTLEPYVLSPLLENIDRVYIAESIKKYSQCAIDKDRILNAISTFFVKLPTNVNKYMAVLFTEKMNETVAYAGVIKSFQQEGKHYVVELHEGSKVKVKIATPGRLKIGHVLVTTAVGKTNVFGWNAFKSFFDIEATTYRVLKDAVIKMHTS